MTAAEPNESSEPPGRPSNGRPCSDHPVPADVTDEGPPWVVNIEIGDPGQRLSPGQERWLALHVERALLQLGTGGDVRVRVVGDEEMRAAHEEFLGEASTTDVITFDMSEPGSGRLDTDILICHDEGARQAAGRSHAVEQELLLYIIHGVLHCMGYDDHDAVAAGRMHAAEDHVLEALGVGATYNRPDRAGGVGHGRGVGPVEDDGSRGGGCPPRQGRAEPSVDASERERR
jgi:probable rRNA maturation factor